MTAFSFKNCGKTSDPIQVKELQVAPDPIKIPGNVTVSAKASVKRTIKAPIKVNSRLPAHNFLFARTPLIRVRNRKTRTPARVSRSEWCVL